MNQIAYEKECIEKIIDMQAYCNQQLFAGCRLDGYSALRRERLLLALIDRTGKMVHMLQPAWCWWENPDICADRKKVVESFAEIMRLCLTAVLYEDKCIRNRELARAIVCRRRQLFVQGWLEEKAAWLDGDLAADFQGLIGSAFGDMEKCGQYLRHVANHLSISAQDVFEIYSDRSWLENKTLSLHE